MPNPSTSLSSPASHEAQSASRPPSPTAPPYSPITPIMSNISPLGKPPSAHGTYNQNTYPYGPPPPLMSSSDSLHHAHPTIIRPRDQIPSQQLQYSQLQPQGLSQSQHHPQQQHKQQQQLPTQYPHSQPHPQAHSQPQSQPHYPKTPQMQSLPPSKPISESDNPDAIALRAAMSVLQLQRQQALRDMRILERQKDMALSDPEGFARGVAEGRIMARGTTGILPANRSDETDEEEEADEDERQRHELGEIPSAQNVVRMPPINWAQYHIVGESLDKLHKEQRIRPTAGVLGREEDLKPRERERERGVEAVIAAPYNPFVDRLEKVDRGGAKKGAGTGAGTKKKG